MMTNSHGLTRWTDGRIFPYDEDTGPNKNEETKNLWPHHLICTEGETDVCDDTEEQMLDPHEQLIHMIS